jgi:hypothetical protein
MSVSLNFGRNLLHVRDVQHLMVAGGLLADSLGRFLQLWRW